jgi:hypothetical protein
MTCVTAQVVELAWRTGITVNPRASKPWKAARLSAGGDRRDSQPPLSITSTAAPVGRGGVMRSNVRVAPSRRP